MEKEKAQLGTAMIQASSDQECAMLGIRMGTQIRTQMIELTNFDLEMARVVLDLTRQQAQLGNKKAEAVRLENEMAEMIERTVNVESARNSPNMRVYQNSKVKNADNLFFSALKEVYKATVVYEYYTSSTYWGREQLYLIRMAELGDYNLQTYLLELEDAYREFEDYYGVPSLRVAVLDLRDDILQIPWVNLNGSPLTATERQDLFMEAVSGSRYRDVEGNLNFSFSTDSSLVSPLTRNHKISFVEACLTTLSGDLMARVYLNMRGTGSVRPLGGGDANVYGFPERIAVLNAYDCQGKDSRWDPGIWKNGTLTDRPLFNSEWVATVPTVVNESINASLRPSEFSNMKFYIYYKDFTQF